MFRHGWMIPGFMMVLVWTCSYSFFSSGDKSDSSPFPASAVVSRLSACLTQRNTVCFIADNFYGVINATKHNGSAWNDSCTIFLQRNTTRQKKLWKVWPQVEVKGSLLLYVPKDLVKKSLTVYTRAGKNSTNANPNQNFLDFGPVVMNIICGSGSTYDKAYCENIANVFNDKYLLNMTNHPECINCDNPIKGPDETLTLNTSVESIVGNTPGEVDASSAATFVANLANLVSQMNGTSAELSAGEGVKGMLVRQADPTALEPVSLAYQAANSNLNIIDDAQTLSTFSRSVTVSKEAFQQAMSSNISIPFAAIIRFLNMTSDDKNSTVLQNEVIGIDMGAKIKNLSDPVNITFKNLIYSGNPHCHSWNGDGGRPNWTNAGCETIKDANGGIICQCTHLTFFAILLTPINETISSTDLKYLTTISQAGCGLSMFFLGVGLFMHFLLRRTKASQTTVILIHLMLAMFLLNFTFLINNSIAKMKNLVGCQVMAAVMHFSMLATFSWFAGQAFHLCLQLYTGGQIAIKRYILKISVINWAIPAVIAIIIACLGKYGLETIYTDDPANNVDMCWITDVYVHYIVNIGYYSLVFLFTFTTVIITVSWLFGLEKSKVADEKGGTSGKSVLTIMGLCCQLGVSWGFAFFAYGALRIPATYIFTILNSFQGFFLFIYYYNSTKARASAAAGSSSSQTSTSVSTIKSGLDVVFNPYDITHQKSK